MYCYVQTGSQLCSVDTLFSCFEVCRKTLKKTEGKSVSLIMTSAAYTYIHIRYNTYITYFPHVSYTTWLEPMYLSNIRDQFLKRVY